MFTLFLFPVFMYASVSGNNPPPADAGFDVHITNPLDPSIGNDLPSLVSAVLNKIVLPLGAVVAVAYIIYAGFTFVTAQGKPAEIDKAKQRLLWALIGTGILLAAAGISTVVVNTVHCLTNTTC